MSDEEGCVWRVRCVMWGRVSETVTVTLWPHILSGIQGIRGGETLWDFKDSLPTGERMRDSYEGRFLLWEMFEPYCRARIVWYLGEGTLSRNRWREFTVWQSLTEAWLRMRRCRLTLGQESQSFIQFTSVFEYLLCARHHVLGIQWERKEFPWAWSWAWNIF